MSALDRRFGLGALVAASILVAGPTVQAAGKRYALLVAINENHIEGGDLTRLSYAISDANRLAELLVAQGFEKPRILSESGAERTDILRELNWYTRKLDKDDEFVLFYSGHGVRNPEINKQSYWMTYGAGISTLDASAIRLSHLMEYVREMKPVRKIVLLDHCFSGDVVSAQVPPPAPPPVPPGPGPLPAASPAPDTQRAASLPPQHLEPKTAQIVHGELEAGASTAKGVVLIAAARNFAYESDELKQGVFTQALINALSSRVADQNPIDGKLSVTELKTYVSSFVSNFPPAGRQVPAIWSEGVDLDSWMFAPNLPADAAETAARVLAEITTRIRRYERTLTTWNQKDYIGSATMVQALSLLNKWKNAEEAQAKLPPAEANLLAKLQQALDAANLPEDGRGRMVELLFTGGE